MCLDHRILLHPQYFGPRLIDVVKKKLFTEVEGSCTGKLYTCDGAMFSAGLWMLLVVVIVKLQKFVDFVAGHAC